MATTTAISTPNKSQLSLIAQAPPSTPSPGSWRHPKFDEIARRQRANTFNERNLRTIGWNLALLIALLYSFFHPQISKIFTFQYIGTLTKTTFFVLCLILPYNVSIAILPLIKKKDDLTDIPLTPTQRSLLGLDPSASPPLTPGTQYITPPRYARSPTPRNVSPASRSISSRGTLQSRKGSPAVGLEGGDSPAASPLFQKTRSQAKDNTRRYSYGSPSPLGPGLGGNDRSVLGAPSTPSPTSGRGATVALNSKWLYEKGRRGSGVYS